MSMNATIVEICTYSIYIPVLQFSLNFPGTYVYIWYLYKVMYVCIHNITPVYC